MKFDYSTIQEQADRRMQDLKRFEVTHQEFHCRMQVLFEILAELQDLTICYQELDDETKAAIPSNIRVVLGIQHVDKVFENLLGNEDHIGLKHMYEE